MSRHFKKPDYEATLKTTIQLSEALPANHLARFVVDVVGQLDLKSNYSKYGRVGGEAIAPEILLGILFYGYASGMFSSRKLERQPTRVSRSGILPAAYILTMTR